MRIKAMQLTALYDEGLRDVELHLEKQAKRSSSPFFVPCHPCLAHLGRVDVGDGEVPSNGISTKRRR